MYKIAGYFASIEVTGLLGFIIVSRYQEGALSRFIPLLVALVAIGYVAYSKAGAISYKEIIYISIMTSAFFIFVVQVLGFTAYSGLSKDIDFFSGTNVLRTGIMLIIGVTAHLLLLGLVRIVRGNPGGGGP